MIPKIIHYCWFGGKSLPKSALKCMESWKKFCPDYEIKEWNESNFDVNIVRYTQEAYEAQKYAFVSDYARFDIIYREGGIYLDVDVELLKSLDDLLVHSAYMGFEKPDGVAAGLGFGAIAGHELFKVILEDYKVKSFIKKDGKLDFTTVVWIVTVILVEKGLVLDNTMQEIMGCTIYPAEYFQPIDLNKQKKVITENTYSIHHYDSSWYTKKHRFAKRMSRIFGARITRCVKKVLRKRSN